MSYEFRKFKPREELPTFDPATQTGEKPKQLNETRKSAGVLYVAGAGSKQAKVMFIMPALQEDDAQEDMGNGSFRIPNKPRYLKSAAGGLFKDLLEQTGLPVQEQYVTAICKWLLPKAQRGKPKATAIAWADDLLDQEIRDINPQIIVCLGKTVFDHLFPLKLKLGEIAGGWFHCEKYNCRLYPMDDIMKPLLKPEYIDKFRIDLIEVKKMLDLCNGVAAPKIEQRYQVIANSSQLLQLVTKLFTERRTTLSVDCEWGGNHHVDGKLRSLQICWAPGEAAYIRFMDETCQYAFDVDYRQAGTILGMWLNQPQVRYIGHQLTADMAWMSHTLGLEIYRKSAWDTLYAAQVIDENQEGKLERLAMAYTDLGRYDIELTIWKKENHLGEDEGYGRIPDSILIDYACRDVDAVMRMYPMQVAQMRQQGEGLLDYYLNLFLPFVTDIFCNFTLVGLPMDLERLTKLRTMYLLARDRLQERFQERIKQEARKLFVIQLGKIDAIGGITAFHAIDAALKAGESAQAMELFKAFTPPEKFGRLLPFYEHFVDAPAFNIRSVNQMKRWLYDVKGFTPIKSTNNKEKGLPSMDWSKVMTLPENSRKEISPSCDKQTLKVLAEQDSLVMELLGLNAVGNLTKAFLRPAELDDEGNLVKENGLHFWVASDGRVHGQFATTETGRPRSWKPNSLNWPSWVTSQISDAILRLVQEEPEDSDFRRAYVDLVGNPRDEKGKLVPPPSIRSCISAQAIQGAQEEGWCLVESDYQTAEVRGLAYISGDENLIRLMNEPDKQFGAIAGGDLEKDRVRLCYDPEYGIAAEHQNPEFILAKVEDGKVVKRITAAELHRNPDGTVWNPKHDLHWNLAEMSLHVPREVLQKKKHRDGLGKTGNFKCLQINKSLVLTSNGVKQINQVIAGSDLVWDGVEWVGNDGFISHGTKQNIEYEGVAGTADHEVYLQGGGKTRLGEAALQGWHLRRTGSETQGALRPGLLPGGLPRAASRIGIEAKVRVPVVRGDSDEVLERAVQVDTPSLRMHQSAGLLLPDVAVQLDEAALREVEPCSVLQLSRSWDSFEVSKSAALRYVGKEELWRNQPSRSGLRPDQQRRTLQSGKHSFDFSGGESAQHADFCLVFSGSGREVPIGASRSYDESYHGQKSPAVGEVGGRDRELLRGAQAPHTGLHIGELSSGESEEVHDSPPGSRFRRADDHKEFPDAQGNRERNTGSMGEVLRKPEELVSVLEGASVHGGEQGRWIHVQYRGRHVQKREEGRGPIGYLETEAGPRQCVPDCQGLPEDGRSEDISDTRPMSLRSGDTPRSDYSGLSEDELLAELDRRGFAIEMAEVGDLLNAGPRHRFTCNGVLVSNCAYGSSPGSMERAIEAETGSKPEANTGQLILDTLSKRQPIADAFLKALELVPDNARVLNAASGRIRHFRPHDSMSSVGKRIRDKVTSGLARQARNFYMQESVAATSARAAIWMNEFCRKHGLKARIITVLYDSVVTLCPLSERFAVQILHQLYMTDVNAWTYHGRELTYPIDTEFNYRWSCRPSKAEQKKLDDPKWNHNEALTAMVSAFAEETRKQHRAKAA